MDTSREPWETLGGDVTPVKSRSRAHPRLRARGHAQLPCLPQFSSVLSLSHAWLFVTPWTAACHLGFFTLGPDSDLGAPPGFPSSSPALSQTPPALSPQPSPSVFLSLLLFPWQPHPLLCHSVLRSHLFLSSFISPLIAVYSPNPPSSFASGL